MFANVNKSLLQALISKLNFQKNTTTGEEMKISVAPMILLLVITLSQTITTIIGMLWASVRLASSLSVNDVKLFGGKLYASTYGVGVLMSSDGGETWEKINNGLSGKRLFNFKRVGDKIAINSSGHSVSLLPIWRDWIFTKFYD